MRISQKRKGEIPVSLFWCLVCLKKHGLGYLAFLASLSFHNSSGSEYLVHPDVLVIHILNDYSNLSELLLLCNCLAARLCSTFSASPCCNLNNIFRNDARFLNKGYNFISYIPKCWVLMHFFNVTFYVSKSPGQLKNFLSTKMAELTPGIALPQVYFISIGSDKYSIVIQFLHKSTLNLKNIEF